MPTFYILGTVKTNFKSPSVINIHSASFSFPLISDQNSLFPCCTNWRMFPDFWVQGQVVASWRQLGTGCEEGQEFGGKWPGMAGKWEWGVRRLILILSLIQLYKSPPGHCFIDIVSAKDQVPNHGARDLWWQLITRQSIYSLGSVCPTK